MSEYDAHVRLWRDSPAGRRALYEAMRAVAERGSLPPVEPWAMDDLTRMAVQPSGTPQGLDWWRLCDTWESVDAPPPPAPTTGSQWCGVLHPDAPRECVVREQRSSIGYREWTYTSIDGLRDAVTAAGTVSRSASPATPASIPHTRDNGRVEWRDDRELWWPSERLMVAAGDYADRLHQLELVSPGHTLYAMLHRHVAGLPRARLLGGASPGDPPSPWWEGDGRDGNSLTWRVPSVP